MVATPWGASESLREMKLVAGGGVSQEDARRSQRLRLFGAMVACCEVKGFEATSVADLLEVSGVSRGTFYENFEGKLGCFEEAAEAVVGDVMAVITHRLAAETEADPEARARAALERFIDLVIAQPAAARMALVESYAAGEQGMAPVRRTVESIIALGQGVLEEMPGRGQIPDDLARPVIGGLHEVIYTSLKDGREAELSEMVPEMWEWMMSYSAPPRELDGGGRRPSVAENPTPPPFAALDPEQRIIRAFAAAVARKGYLKTTISDVAAAGSISLSTIYEHFADKADLMAAALDSSGSQMLAAVLPRARRAPDWPTATRVMLEATLGFLACEPDFAALRTTAVYAAGPTAIAQRNKSGGTVAALILGPTFGDVPELSRLTLRAIEGAIYGTIYERVRTRGPASLPDLAPLLTYVALAPVLGADRACAVADGEAP